MGLPIAHSSVKFTVVATNNDKGDCMRNYDLDMRALRSDVLKFVFDHYENVQMGVQAGVFSQRFVKRFNSINACAGSERFYHSFEDFMDALSCGVQSPLSVMRNRNSSKWYYLKPIYRMHSMYKMKESEFEFPICHVEESILGEKAGPPLRPLCIDECKMLIKSMLDGDANKRYDESVDVVFTD